MSGLKIVSKIESDEEYLAAVRFAETFTPNPEKDYEWVIAHSDLEYKRLESIGKDLDTKADSFIRYLGLVASALSLLAGSNLTSLNIGGSKLHILPAVILMIVGIVFALSARLPEIQPLPMATTHALEYANWFSSAMIARTCCAAMTNAASVGLRLANQEKAGRIRWAFWFLIFALAWLVVAPLATSILTLIGRC